MYAVGLCSLIVLLNFSLSNITVNANVLEILKESVQNSSSAVLAPQFKRRLIIDGSLAILGQFPHMVSLQIDGRHVCGGSLIFLDTIVTAAHCIYKVTDPYRYTAVAGIVDLKEFNLETIQISRVVSTLIHGNFVNGEVKSDIALLKVEKRFIETPYVGSIKLAPSGYEPSGFGRVVGWGSTVQGGPISNRLMETMLTIFGNDQCRYYYGQQIDNTVYCAAPLTRHEDTCNGDSGGPMLCNDFLCGIIAAGIGCGKRDEAGIYTKISEFIPWIIGNSYYLS